MWQISTVYRKLLCKAFLYWIKILNMPCYRLPNICYSMMLLYDKNGHKNWVSDIRNILFSIGFGHIWLNQDKGIELEFIQSFTLLSKLEIDTLRHK